MVLGLVLLAWVVPPASPLAVSDRPPEDGRIDPAPDSTVVAVEIRGLGPSESGAGPIQECSVTYYSPPSRGRTETGSKPPPKSTVLKISIRHESAR
jgi:hypothetical protein